MSPASGREHVDRPLYGAAGWAYDLVVPDASHAQTAWILDACEVAPGMSVLDAGCGTGRLLEHLLDAGVRAVGVDLAPSLVQAARARTGASCAAVANLAALPIASSVDVVVCRGVLNDVIEAPVRDAVLAELARVLRRGGRVFFDVREWEASRAHYATNPRAERRAVADGDELRFEAVTTPMAATKELHIIETLSWRGDVLRHEFVMRCWTEDEVRDRVGRAGLADIRVSFADGTCWRRDRLLVTAMKATS